MSSVHRIRWKGRTTGPYSREDIRARLATGEFSLLHRVEVSDRWIGLDEFLGERQAAPATPSPVASGGAAPTAGATPDRITIHAPLRIPSARRKSAPDEGALGYFLCGLCFVLPLAATIAAAVHAWNVRRLGDSGRANTLFALAALFTALGAVFWIAVGYAYSRGVI